MAEIFIKTFVGVVVVFTIGVGILSAILWLYDEVKEWLRRR